MKPRTNMRTALWIVALVAMLVGWWADRNRMEARHQEEMQGAYAVAEECRRDAANERTRSTNLQAYLTELQAAYERVRSNPTGK